MLFFIYPFGFGFSLFILNCKALPSESCKDLCNLDLLNSFDHFFYLHSNLRVKSHKGLIYAWSVSSDKLFRLASLKAGALKKGEKCS